MFTFFVFIIYLGGSLTRQVEQDASVSDSSPHIANIGKMVEDMENKIRYVMYKILMYIVSIGIACHYAQTIVLCMVSFDWIRIDIP